MKKRNMKIERLQKLQHTIAELRCEAVEDREEYQFYMFISSQTYDKLHEEYQKQGYMAVYPIINGCSGEAIFIGTKDECRAFVTTLKEKNPSAEVIVLQI